MTAVAASVALIGITGPVYPASAEGSATPPTLAPHDLGALIPGGWSYATGINNDDQVVGVAQTAQGSHYHAFLWSDGRMRDLGSLLPGGNSQALGINNSGEVVGWTDSPNGQVAFKYQHGRMTALPGDKSAVAVNNRGQVVGSDAVVWQPDGTMTTLPVGPPCLRRPDGQSYGQGADGINDKGQVVGWCYVDIRFNGLLQGTVVWDAAGNLSSAPGGWNGYAAINNKGEVIGQEWQDLTDPLLAGGVTYSTQFNSSYPVLDNHGDILAQAYGTYAVWHPVLTTTGPVPQPPYPWIDPFPIVEYLGGLPAASAGHALGVAMNTHRHVAGWINQQPGGGTLDPDSQAVLWK